MVAFDSLKSYSYLLYSLNTQGSTVAVLSKVVCSDYKRRLSNV